MHEAIKLRGHHLKNLKQYLKRGSLNFYRYTFWDTAGDYGFGFAGRVCEIYSKIVQNPDLKVKVVIGEKDDVCSGCKKFKTCEETEDKKSLDQILIEGFEMHGGEVYISKDLLDKLRKKFNEKLINKSICYL